MAQVLRHATDVLRQAKSTGPITVDEDLPSGVQAVLGGPSGAVAASDALFAEYADLTPDQAVKLRAEIIDAMKQPQGWSIQSITKRLAPIYEEAGFDQDTARQRANLVSKMESRSIASEIREQQFAQEEARREKQFKYRLRGGDDFRTTKLSRWQRAQIPSDGVTLERMKEILDEGISLAKTGAFAPNGALSSITGQPIRLPPDFQRRGFISHFGDRDTVVQLT